MNLKDITSKSFAAGVGALVVCIMDIAVRDKLSASVITKIGHALELLLDTQKVSLIFPTISIIVFSSYLSHLMEPDTKMRAFIYGTGILSTLMTFSPTNFVQDSPPLPTTPQTEASANYLENTNISFLNILTPTLAHAGVSSADDLVEINLTLKPDDFKKISRATLLVKNAKTKKIVGKSILTGPSFNFFLQPGEYLITVEAPNYLLEYKKFSIKNGKTQQIDFNLKHSDVPIWLQKLF